MRRTVASLAVLLTFAAGCATTPTTEVAPGDGPAAAEPSATEPMHDEYTEEPTEDAGAPDEGGADEEVPEQEVASFTDKYVYEDGVEVEVTKIRQTKLSDVGSAGDAEVGTPLTVLTVRVKNTTSGRLNTDAASASMTYGPDGDSAEAAYDNGVEANSGTILPGKSRSGTYAFAVPKKYLDDVTMEFEWDYEYEHEAAIFSGSVK